MIYKHDIGMLLFYRVVVIYSGPLMVVANG